MISRKIFLPFATILTYDADYHLLVSLYQLIVGSILQFERPGPKLFAMKFAEDKSARIVPCSESTRLQPFADSSGTNQPFGVQCSSAFAVI